MQRGVRAGGALGIGGVRCRIRESGCVGGLELERFRQAWFLTFEGVPRSPVAAGTVPLPAGGNVNRGSCYECRAQYCGQMGADDQRT